jgi:hypothetical protein
MLGSGADSRAPASAARSIVPSFLRVASSERPFTWTLSSAAVRAATLILRIFATADASETGAALAAGTSLSDFTVTSPSPTWICACGCDQSTLTGRCAPSVPPAMRAASMLPAYGWSGGSASASSASLRSARLPASVKPPEAFSVPPFISDVLSV